MPKPKPRGAAKSEAAKVRAYLAKLPSATRKALTRIRGLVKAAVPGGKEGISYAILVVRSNGKPVVWYAGWKAHTSMYPLTAEFTRANAAALAKFETAKGTVRFPLTRPVPATLVRRLARARLAAVRRKATD